jgi:uncharacterized protein (TIGR03437 family)
VTIGGAPASLFFISSEQINAVVNTGTPTGSEAVVVYLRRRYAERHRHGQHERAPGLFSLFGTGTRDGAVLNAITFLLGDFSTPPRTRRPSSRCSPQA